MIRVAFDVGGTFTDFALQASDTGRSYFSKTPTTPADPAVAVLAGLDRLLGEAGIDAGAIDAVLHATTVATNAVIERKGGATALITTKGFRDILIIGRQKRYDTYDLYLDKPEPLVKRRAIFEVAERVDHEGAVVTPLDEASLDEAVGRVAAGEFESVAVALLHSYANPSHEIAVRRALAERAPDLPVSLSCDVSPKFREYERTNTTVANAYVKPVVARYVARLQDALAERGFRHDLFIMQSNGGLVSPDAAREYPIRIVESGPAAGVLMCAKVGRDIGSDHLLTFDMGGTTAKLGAIDDGEPAVLPTFEVDLIRNRPGSGLPINVPAIELLEIGAGGGSIAATDMGAITVGPESAGADPGPICYGQGGNRPTNTDANVALGYINPDYFNGGAMQLDKAAAEAGIARAIGEPLGLSMIEAAWGIHVIANNNMEHAMRLVSVERGRDPRRYAMVAFGGAGPVHAARLARALGVPTVVVPFGAGVGSAVGLLQADAKIDVSTTRLMTVTAQSSETIAEIYRGLESRARNDVTRIGLPGEPQWHRYAYMRYAGQGYEIHVDLPDGPVDSDYAALAMEAFLAAYERRHNYRDADAAIEAVDWYLVATLPTAKSNVAAEVRQAAAARATSQRPAYFPEAGGFVDTALVDRASIGVDNAITGPAIIEDPDATTLVLPGDRARIDGAGHLIIEISADK